MLPVQIWTMDDVDNASTDAAAPNIKTSPEHRGSDTEFEQTCVGRPEVVLAGRDAPSWIRARGYAFSSCVFAEVSTIGRLRN